MKLAVIPARGGSKRIPRKNIKLFGGKPMIAWSIEAAIASECFDRIIVSTDDEEIASIAQSCGAEVPFVRPASLADDHTSTTSVVVHAINWFREHSQIPDKVCCIYATAPFITAATLRRGLKTLEDTGSEFSFAVTSYAFPIQRAVRITKQGRVEMLEPEKFNTRSQDLEEVFHDAGQFYWGKSRAWLSGKPVFGKDASTVHVPRHLVQDIDTSEDWIRAELMFTALDKRTAI